MSEPPPSAPAEPDSPDGPSEISLQNPNRYADVQLRQLRPWLRRAAAAVVAPLAPPRPRTLAVRFVSDREMRRLNHTFRAKDRPTDVLSFPGDRVDPAAAAAQPLPMAAIDDFPRPDLDAGDAAHLGDIVIAVPTARRQAEAAGHAVERELQQLMLHGLLHCVGFDHETDDGRMGRREQTLRATLIAGDEAVHRG
ncbi:MAG: rRNA maturation RNase YbeY [Acidobacteriota bacterium]